MTHRPALSLLLCGCLALAAPAHARDALGMFGAWGAFRDPAIPRCYAIAMAQPGRTKPETTPYADVGLWPRKGVRGQIHFRLSRRMQPGAHPQLSLGGQHYRLIGGATDAWAADAAMEAAILAAMRSGESMSITARDTSGHPFTDQYTLPGAATAMDAAALACAQTR